MPNITLSLDEATLDAARAYAKDQGWSLNELIRSLIRASVAPRGLDKLDAVFAKADELKCESTEDWRREDLHERSMLR